MPNVIVFPKRRHGRASAGLVAGDARAARRVKSSDVSPVDRPFALARITDHHSAGMLSRCHHLDTCERDAPMSDAQASRVGHNSMMDRNDCIPGVLGQNVPYVKADSSHDLECVVVHDFFMGQLGQDDDFDVREREFWERFKARLVEIQGRRSDAQMADLLGLSNGAERYKKWRYRAKSEFPMHLLPKLAAIGATTVQELVESAAGLERIKRPPPKDKSPRRRQTS